MEANKSVPPFAEGVHLPTVARPDALRLIRHAHRPGILTKEAAEGIFLLAVTILVCRISAAKTIGRLAPKIPQKESQQPPCAFDNACPRWVGRVPAQMLVRKYVRLRAPCRGFLAFDVSAVGLESVE